MKESYDCGLCYLDGNRGKVGGQIAMHARMHVIPRFRQEPYAGRGMRYWLKRSANRW